MPPLHRLRVPWTALRGLSHLGIQVAGRAPQTTGGVIFHDVGIPPKLPSCFTTPRVATRQIETIAMVDLCPVPVTIVSMTRTGQSTGIVMIAKETQCVTFHASLIASVSGIG